ncbi:Rhs family protein [Proteus hauseri ZMd44]|nr:Rhs family protein [Proteus hauseri ZMd44]
MSSPKIRRTQTGFRKPGQIDGIKRAMLDGTFEFEEKRIGGWLDSKGTYYIGEGHHRMAAIQEIYKKQVILNILID